MRDLYFEQEEIRLGGSKLTFGYKGTNQIPRSHSAEILGRLCSLNARALQA